MSSDLLRFQSPASVADGSALDDRVMGGVSRSRLRYDPAGHAVWVKVVGPGRVVHPTMLGDAPLLTWMLGGLGMRRLISAWPADS